MLISVIVPVYNVEQYLEQCLDSIVNQTYRDIEILCVNDGSLDNSLSILKRYADKDDRIKIIDQPNRGLSVARNTALDMASGDVVSFVDSDDYIDLDTYRLVADEFAKDGSLDIVEIGYCEFFPDGSRYSTIPDIQDADSEKRLFLNKTGNISFFVCCKCIRRHLLGGVRFPEGRYYEDNVFNFRILNKTNNIKSIPKPLYFYRQRKGSITEDSLSEKIVDIAVTLDDYYECEKDTYTKKMLSLYILCNIRNRIEYSLYNYGMRGGMFYYVAYSTYIRKYRVKGIAGMPFVNLWYKIRMYVFCYLTKMYMFVFALLVPLYKRIKALKS